jgi:Tfp pilus assembly protein FimT
MTLMAILVGLTIGTSRSQTGKACSRSAAELLASLLRSSRQQAILTGMPVSLCPVRGKRGP